MSVAVAIEKDGVIALATDSQTSIGQEKLPVKNFHDDKIMHIGDSYMASTGWSVYSNIVYDWLENNRHPPQLQDTASIFLFFKSLWAVLHDRYHLVKDQEDDSESPFGSLDSSFLIIAPRGIFSVAPDLAVSRIQNYFAIGAGAEVALGSLYTTHSMAHGAEAIATTAIEAAIAHNIYCGAPINSVVIQPQTATRSP